MTEAKPEKEKSKPVGKLHLTIDGVSPVCERSAKESTSNYGEVTCNWCLGRIKHDPIRYLVAFAQAGAPKPVLLQLWQLACAAGSPEALLQQKIVDLEVELLLQREVLTALGTIIATHQF